MIHGNDRLYNAVIFGNCVLNIAIKVNVRCATFSLPRRRMRARSVVLLCKFAALVHTVAVPVVGATSAQTSSCRRTFIAS